MADSSTSPNTADQNSQSSGLDDSSSNPGQPDSSTAPPPPPPSPLPAVYPNPTALPPPIISPPQIQPYPPPQASSVTPLFRPAVPSVPLPTVPQFSPIPNPIFQTAGVQPPGVNPLPGMVAPGSGAGSVGASSVPPLMPPYAPPGQQPNPALRPYALLPNGYQVVSVPAPQGTVPPTGFLRFSSPYASMVRPVFPLRPLGAVGIVPVLPRPPVLGIRPIIPAVIRPPMIPSVTPTEKPQTTVYVGKIASTVENDFMLSVLQLCGPVKSWKRAQDPSTGALKGYGFCEFESPEGVLRALRLLSKLDIDGQEIMLNVSEATKDYLKRYVEKKKENSKNLKTTETESVEKEEGNESGTEKNELPKLATDGSKEAEPSNTSAEASKEETSDEMNKENDDTSNFGLITNEDKDADREASGRLSGLIEERLKMRPLQTPPQTTGDDSNSEVPARSREGTSDVDMTKNDAAEDKHDEEMTSESKPSSEHDKPEASSPDRSRRNDRRSGDRGRDLKRDKERELERYEREREQERAKREREREYKIREDERRYRARVKEWESREKEKERVRKLEKEREKEREQNRRHEVMDQEYDSDDGYSKKRKYKSSGEEREERKRRIREKEEDMADRVKEDEEIAEEKRRLEEEREMLKKREKQALELLPRITTNVTDKAVLSDEPIVESKDKSFGETLDGDFACGNSVGNGVAQNGSADESLLGSVSSSDARQNNNAPSKKLGFGLVGSGKRTAVLSVFHEEDEDSHKENKMRPLVPIDYSTEELQAVRDTTPVTPSPNLVAAAEFAKRIGTVNSKEEKIDSEKERSRHKPYDKSYNQRDRDRDRERNFEESNRLRDESRKENVKAPDNKKLLDAKQLIDTIPKTKDELFAYEINWATYDKNGLHERMRPWISKKITEFLGEEVTSLVDYIVSSTQEHVKASEMLERLQSLLDDEAEMFVLKMWRMLIFEIKKVETGLASRTKA